jgi:single-strand DNA-binding protein
MSVNKVILVGRVGKDTESRAMPSGESIAIFSLATSEKFKDKQSGQYRESTEWHNISCFGGIADVANKYVKKGSQVYVEGKIKTNKYTDKAGVEKYVTNIIVSSLQLLGSKEPSKEREEISNKPSSSLGVLDDDSVPF